MVSTLPTLGIDLVEIKRFQQWHTYSDAQLRKIFSAQEIAYCKSVPIKSAERFAARFAAKEALYKALSPHIVTERPPTFLYVCQQAELKRSVHGIFFAVNWDNLKSYYGEACAQRAIQTSLSHTHTTACAVVMICSFT